MRVHHLNCATMCPLGGRLVSGDSKQNARLVCHCLLIETERSGLVLVDTGFGTADCLHPERVSRELRSFGRPLFSIEETARRQIENLGFTVQDVRHVLTTHLDVDHTGGLPDFPDATVHVHEVEQEAALNPKGMIERKRYDRNHLKHGPKWAVYRESGGERWFGFEAVRQLAGLPPEILAIPLFGHTRGHCAVAVDVGGGRWLMHAGDAYFFREEKEREPRCPAGLAMFQRVVAADDRVRRENQVRLRGLAGEGGVEVFCAHDAEEYRVLAHD